MAPRSKPRKRPFGQTPLMFAAAINRVDAIKALLKAGADVKATSKVNNVGNLSGAEAGIPRGSIGQRQPGRRQRHGPQRPGRGARSAGAGGGAAAAGGGGGGGRGGPAAASPASSVRIFYNELIGTQGGHTRADARGAQRLRRRGEDARRRRRGRQSDQRRRQDQPDADRRDQRPLRSREVAARPGRQSERRVRQRRDAALRRAERARGRRARSIRSRARSTSSRSPISTS